jgi:hypothetical protein
VGLNAIGFQKQSDPEKVGIIAKRFIFMTIAGRVPARDEASSLEPVGMLEPENSSLFN